MREAKEKEKDGGKDGFRALSTASSGTSVLPLYRLEACISLACCRTLRLKKMRVMGHDSAASLAR